MFLHRTYLLSCVLINLKVHGSRENALMQNQWVKLTNNSKRRDWRYGTQIPDMEKWESELHFDTILSIMDNAVWIETDKKMPSHIEILQIQWFKFYKAHVEIRMMAVDKEQGKKVYSWHFFHSSKTWRLSEAYDSLVSPL